MKRSFFKTLQPGILAQIKADTLLYSCMMAVENHNFHGYFFQKMKEHLKELGQPYDDFYINEGILALQQYYAVAVLDRKNMHAISKPLDPFWHMHILFTADYRRFCDDVYGEYMDHDPLHSKDDQKASIVEKFYLHTLEVNKKLFVYTSPEFYPTDVTQADMICWHFNDESPEDKGGLLPVNQELMEEYSKIEKVSRLRMI